MILSSPFVGRRGNSKEDLIMGMFSGQDLDPVLIGSIITIAVSTVVVVYLGLKIRKLMNSTHSED